MSKATIAFIGAGNMAGSIIGGLLNSGHPAENIRAADPFPASLERLAAMGPVALFDDNAAAVSGAEAQAQVEEIRAIYDSLSAATRDSIVIAPDLAATMQQADAVTGLGDEVVATARTPPRTGSWGALGSD